MNELTQVESLSEQQSSIKLLSEKAYSEVLAPVYDVNDFSTEYLNRLTGDNLSGAKLASQTSYKMVEMILLKAGIIRLARVMRLVEDGCQVAKIETPTTQEVVSCLQR
jgi:hypothetical protein